MRHAYLRFWEFQRKVVQRTTFDGNEMTIIYFLSIGERCCRNISDELVVSNSESSEMVSGLMKMVAAVVVGESVGVISSTNGSSFVANLPVTILDFHYSARNK